MTFAYTVRDPYLIAEEQGVHTTTSSSPPQGTHEGCSGTLVVAKGTYVVEVVLDGIL